MNNRYVNKTKNTAIYVLIIALFVVGGMGLLLFKQRVSSSAVNRSSSKTKNQVATAEGRKEAASMVIAPADPVLRKSRILLINGPSYKFHIATLVARKNPMGLNMSDVNDIQEIYNEFYKKKEEIEIGLAKAKLIKDGEIEITIPKYEAEGNELLKQFETSIDTILGKVKADQFLGLYEADLKDFNFGLGNSEQDINVKVVNQSVANREWEIVHTTKLADLNSFGSFTKTSKSVLSSSNLDRYEPFKAMLP